MPESNSVFAFVNIYESTLYQHQQMHLLGINLSFSLLNASPNVLLPLKCFDKICFLIFTVKTGFILLRVEFVVIASVILVDIPLPYNYQSWNKGFQLSLTANELFLVGLLEIPQLLNALICNQALPLLDASLAF